MENPNPQKQIIPAPESGISAGFSDLAKRGLDLIPQLKFRYLYVPSEYKTVEEAVANAKEGDTIFVAPGKYNVAATIDKSLTIQGMNSEVIFSPGASSQLIEKTVVFSKDASPILKIIAPGKRVVIQNIKFVGVDSVYYPSAINSIGVRLEILDCEFLNFDMGAETQAFLDIYHPYLIEINPTIKISGDETEIVLAQSKFNLCKLCIDANKTRDLSISKSNFIKCNHGMILRTSSKTILSQSEFSHCYECINSEDVECLSVSQTLFVECESVMSLKTSSEMVLERCEFSHCNRCIDAENNRNISILQNHFIQCIGGLVLRKSNVILKKNLFRCSLPLALFNSEVKSNYDTYFSDGEVLWSNTTKKISFHHCTVISERLITIIPVRSHFDKVNVSDEIILEKPLIVFCDSIISIQSRLVVVSPELQNRLILEDLVKYERNNLVTFPPAKNDNRFQLNYSDDNEITLLPTSPAINAASDGTNLGAWQGN